MSTGLITDKIAALKSAVFMGVSPAMATPLTENGTVNVDVIPQLVDFLIDRGVKGIFVGGTTGEGLLLPVSERIKLHETAVNAINGRVPTLVHVGANDVPTATALTKHAVYIKADAIVAVPPYFFGLPDSDIINFFAQITTHAPNIPFLVYDIPHLAINGISPSMVQTLGEMIPSFAGVKCSRLDAQAIINLIHALPERGFLLAGNERIASGSLALGAIGLISGMSTATPEPFVKLVNAFANKDHEVLQTTQRFINAFLNDTPSKARIGAIKRILMTRGVPVGNALPPRPTPDSYPNWEKHVKHID